MDIQTVSVEADALAPGTEEATISDLKIRTRGEELWLWRLRNLSLSGKVTGRGGTAMSQVEAAEFLGIDRAMYASAEKDQCPVRDIESILSKAHTNTPTVGELCALARRRSGMRLVDAEKVLGLSRPAYLSAESAGDERVVKLWRDRGYQF